MGGEIGVESEPGQGSDVLVHGRASAKQPTPRRRRADAGATLRGLRVLVVDDNATNRAILHEQLAALGHAARRASAAAREALAALRARGRGGTPFDLALLDCQMPGMDGLDAGRARSARRRDRRHAARHADVARPRTTTARAAREPGIAAVPDQAGQASRSCSTRSSRVARGTAASRAGRRRPARRAASAADGARASWSPRTTRSTSRSRCGMLRAARATRSTSSATAREAVEALGRDRATTSVLMDCQMPEMDGFEATGAIRAPRSAPARRIADHRHDRQRHGRATASAASPPGMDDYITKPVKVPELDAVLSRWDPDRATPRVEAAATASLQRPSEMTT